MDTLEKLWRVRRTVCELLIDRGYPITRANTMTVREFADWAAPFGADPRDHMVFQPPPRVGDPAPAAPPLVIFLAESVGVRHVRDVLVSQLDSAGTRHAILVVQKGVTPSARKELVALQPEYLFELFDEQELLENVTKHELVPRHQKVADPVLVGKIKQRYCKNGPNKNWYHLPAMLQTDPIARWYGFRPGDLVTITRRNGVVYYREVVAPPPESAG